MHYNAKKGWCAIIFFSDRSRIIIASYRNYEIDFLPITIGWDGTTASQSLERPTPNIDSDHLLCGANVNFTNANALIRIQSTSPAYNWMQQNLNVPIHSVAGTVAQVNQYVYWPDQFFLYRQGTLQCTFINSATSLTDTNARFTIVALKLQKKLRPLPWEPQNSPVIE